MFIISERLKKMEKSPSTDELDRFVEIYTVCLRFVNIKLLKHVAE